MKNFVLLLSIILGVVLGTRANATAKSLANRTMSGGAPLADTYNTTRDDSLLAYELPSGMNHYRIVNNSTCDLAYNVIHPSDQYAPTADVQDEWIPPGFGYSSDQFGTGRWFYVRSKSGNCTNGYVTVRVW